MTFPSLIRSPMPSSALTFSSANNARVECKSRPSREIKHFSTKPLTYSCCKCLRNIGRGWRTSSGKWAFWKIVFHSKFGPAGLEATNNRATYLPSAGAGEGESFPICLPKLSHSFSARLPSVVAVFFPANPSALLSIGQLVVRAVKSYFLYVPPHAFG